MKQLEGFRVFELQCIRQHWQSSPVFQMTYFGYGRYIWTDSIPVFVCWQQLESCLAAVRGRLQSRFTSATYFWVPACVFGRARVRTLFRVLSNCPRFLLSRLPGTYKSNGFFSCLIIIDLDTMDDMYMIQNVYSMRVVSTRLLSRRRNYRLHANKNR